MGVIQAIDSLKNLVANLGTSKDKRSQSEWQRRSLDQETLSVMYREDWLAGKIVDVPVEDMTRKWRTFDGGETTTDQIKDLEDAEKDFAVRDSFAEALKWARLYGGAAIIMGIDGAGEMDEPLELERVTEGSLKYILVVDRHDLEIKVQNFTYPDEPDFRKPSFYQLVNGSTQIHHSRVIHFDGLSLPWRERQQENYWGQSILQRVYEAVLNASGISESVNSMTYESKVDVIRVKNLFNELSSKGADAVINRFLAGDQIKSINNMLLLDMDREEYEQKQLQFAGLSDLILRYLNIAAAAADIPATRLLGESAPGLNATGAEQTRQYYDMVSSQQETKLLPALDMFDQVFVRSILGEYPEELSTSFNSLWQNSDSEQAQIELNRAQADKTHVELGTITAMHATKRLKANNTYPIEDDFIMALEEIADAEIELEVEKAGEPPPPPPVMIPGQPPVEGQPEPPMQEELDNEEE
jgi:phage-related protein (TIGR01555 family)